jgi:hypothetical protein
MRVAGQGANSVSADSSKLKAQSLRLKAHSSKLKAESSKFKDVIDFMGADCGDGIGQGA